MLWTMHVCEVDGKFEMYYTGLQRKDRGVVSKIGLAESDNLIDWTKKRRNIFPIEPEGINYETHTTNPRTWLSFRDPFRFEHKGDVYLLVATRTTTGPVSRRGCVGLVKITDYIIEHLPPLLYPMVYADVEFPCVFELHGRFYLLGSIREDVKVRYWVAPDFFGEYQSFDTDILLPQGNYTARTVQDGKHLLVYNFFYAKGNVDTLRVLPPPKELLTDATGRLLLKSYYRWELMVKKGHLSVEGVKGKLGLVTDIDLEGNGYFISFDFTFGLVNIRSWGFNPLNSRQNFIFNNIQSGIFAINKKITIFFSLIRFGNYIEMSIDGSVKSTLIDYTFAGTRVGLYSASSVISLKNTVFKELPDPPGEYASQEEAQKITE